MSEKVLLIRCSEQEAKTIRETANLERRTISGYVLNALENTLKIEESLFARLNRLSALNRTLARTPIRLPGPRTAMLLQCSGMESQRIRLAAKRRQTTISGFVLHSLRLRWNVAGNHPAGS
jgi:uncharacterized protein (DUF1778 family)